MSQKFHLKLVTPERQTYEKEIYQLTVPTTEGQITILPNHLPLVSVLAPGEIMIIETPGKKEEITMAVSGGFLQVAQNQVTILADTAERLEEIDESRSEAARQRAEKLLAEVKNRESVEYTALAVKIGKELARLKVVRRRRHHERGQTTNQ
ncbi:MAG: ATP synthase F1 subunit epsilon [Candidatus Buchananbacteria bacterium RIFCSPHIGHO2_01_FULL_39_14]|uniref:ATP synthase epsilon chain n=1 Tax=Candidatus Buchananbacteria bacterium RIFCSPHIGHO2_01_FULL_39_14 TaxID=1797532 RepID=A0A1G1XZ83_9BACT|nr:MAG: ATP synthase F1 subunit epsilon [Candidatus Buchananbacteria bacterium RIFCSPHIGHO2_01_FULL_39_14]OGY48705.1 MAG: ATP synthase F1 subunit epsilon [Candidatus Buchananbacteria bacterium RIFCSPHIGHO2_02_FULL_39_17]